MKVVYTVKKLAKLAGVTVRTLHFYDEIGLLPPAYYGENGYRYYEEKELLMLQQILFFRELGLDLKQIERVLRSNNFDQLAALVSHKEHLKKEVGRLEQLIETVEKTIKHIKGDREMDENELYFGFNNEEHVKYLIDRYGKEAESTIAECKKNTANWKKEDFDKVKAAGEEINRALCALLDQDAASAAVQTQIAEHFKWIKKFWTPTKESYTNLGQLYIEHSEMREHFDSHDPRLAKFLAEAMRIFAEQKL